MRRLMKGISFDLETYEGMLILKQQHNCSWSELIQKYMPMPFFAAPISVSIPVVKRKITKVIPKQKYNPTADLEDFMKNRCKLHNITPMPFNRKVLVEKSEYDDKTKAFIEEQERNEPWRRKHRFKLRDDK